MTQFNLDVLKIVIDKALLGIVAAGFGYYLSRLLEDYKQSRSYELMLAQRRLDALKEATALLIAQHERLVRLVKVAAKALERRPGILSDDEARPGYEFVNTLNEFRLKLKTLAPFLAPAALQAASKYLDLHEKVRKVVWEEPGAVLPSEEDLNRSVAEFIVAAAGSAYAPDVHDR